MHILIQMTGVVLALTGFVVVFIKAEGNHMAYVHSYFGLTTLIFAVATPLGGALAHFMWNPNRSHIPLFPDQAHWWLGRLTIVLSWITIFLGMKLLGVPYEIITAFGFVLIVYLTGYVWLDVLKAREIGLQAYLFGAFYRTKKDPVLSDYF